MISCRRLANSLLLCLVALPLVWTPDLAAQDAGQSPPYAESPLNLPPKPKPLRRSALPGSEPLPQSEHAPAPKAVKAAKSKKNKKVRQPAPAPAAPVARPKAAKPAKAKPPRVVSPPAAARPAPAAKARPSAPLNRVLAVQEALNRAGYAAPRDGQLNKATKAALRRFQRDHGLKVTGTLNRLTLQRLGVH